jgi:DNA-damage-inducible protein J
MSDRISTRIDHNLKQAATMVFNRLGISEAEAIRMFYAQVELQQGIPFDVKIPNKTTLKAFKESENLDKLKTYKSSKELFKDLGI